MKLRLSDLLPPPYTTAGRVLHFIARLPLLVIAAATAIAGHFLKLSGWSLVGVASVFAVILLAACAFLFVSVAAIVAALVIGAWKFASRVFEFARLFLSWAAV